MKIIYRFQIESTDELFEYINKGNAIRVTSTTGKNLDSSRSHAILQLRIKRRGKNRGLFSFIDLAGNERGGDTYGHDQQTRIDGAEISKSLLALKGKFCVLNNFSFYNFYNSLKSEERQIIL